MPGSEGESTWARSWARKRAGVWSVRERGVRGVQAREKDTQDPAKDRGTGQSVCEFHTGSYSETGHRLSPQLTP